MSTRAYGCRLAVRVAEAFGDGVLAELRPGSWWSHRRYRGFGQATTAEAEGVVARRYEEMLKWARAASANGGRLEWHAEDPDDTGRKQPSADDLETGYADSGFGGGSQTPERGRQ